MRFKTVDKEEASKERRTYRFTKLRLSFDLTPDEVAYAYVRQVKLLRHLARIGSFTDAWRAKEYERRSFVCRRSEYLLCQVHGGRLAGLLKHGSHFAVALG